MELASPSPTTFGPLNGQVLNFLKDAAQGTAVYSASLASQPGHASFQGGGATALVQLAGVPMDYGVGLI